MPIYEYSCTTCESAFERLLKMSEMTVPLAEPCPECQSEGCIVQNATTAAIGDPIKLGVKRPDAGWNEVLTKIKSKHPKGNWNNQRLSPIAGR